MKLKEQIAAQFEFISSIVSDRDRSQTTNTAVSNWSVAEHFDHILKAAQLILSQVIQKEKRATKPQNLLGRFVLFTGRIPKGRKSPKWVLPDRKTPAELADSLSRVKALLNSVDFNNLEQSSFDHHVFGGLNGRQWLRFMTIHNRHHERIVRRILG